MKALFANAWGAKTSIDLGTPTATPPLTALVPETTAAAFGIARLAWLAVGGVPRMRKAGSHG